MQSADYYFKTGGILAPRQSFTERAQDLQKTISTIFVLLHLGRQPSWTLALETKLSGVSLAIDCSEKAAPAANRCKFGGAEAQSRFVGLKSR